MNTLEQIREWIEQWWGSAAVDVVELRRPADADSEDSDAPRDIDVVILEADRGDVDMKTEIVTAGVSNVPVSGPIERFELALTVRGEYPADQIRALARAVAELAVLPHRQGTYHAPGNVVRNATLPVYEAMTAIMITDHGVNAPEWLQRGPDIRLLSMMPLYDSEADPARSLGPTLTVRRILAAGLRDDDPTRAAIALHPRGPGETESVRTPPLASLSDADVAERIAAVWRDIHAWMKDNGASALDALEDGATEEELTEFEEVLGWKLPADYRASLAQHNGESHLSELEYLSIDTARYVWEDASEDGVDEREAREGRPGVIQNVWWHPRWLTFAQDSAGTQYCIDMEPATSGVVGQVIIHDPHNGPLPSGHNSFLEWLTAYRDDVRAGLYRVSDDGEIEAV